MYRLVAPSKWERARDVEVVMDALPQIVALVEAAKSAHDEPYESGTWWRRLGAALAALDEGLP